MEKEQKKTKFKRCQKCKTVTLFTICPNCNSFIEQKYAERSLQKNRIS